MNGETLRRKRITQGLNTADAAKALSITPPHLSRIENGHSAPSIRLLEKMIEVYQIPLEDADRLKIDFGYLKGNDASQDGSVNHNQQPKVLIDSQKTPVHYTNAVFVTSDKYGITIDAGSRIGATNEIQILARIGFSLPHAIKIREALDIHINKLKEQSEG